MKIFLILNFILSCNFSVHAEENFRIRAHKVAQLNSNTYSASDVKAEIEFGRGLAARILNTYPLVDNVKLQQYVNNLGAGLASQIGRPELVYYFAVINSDDVNAYACPGGYVLLTKGLINLLSNEAELVGVLAHEINHVNERHVIKKLKIKGKDESAISGLGAMIGGATASFRVAIKTLSDEAMALLFEKGVMENEELDSDRFAVTALYSAGYKVSAYKDLLEKLKKTINNSGAKVLKKTHPQVSDRLKVVEQFEQKNSSDNTKINKDRFTLYAKL